MGSDFDLLDLPALCERWRTRDAGEWQQSRHLYLAAARRLLACGEPLLAFDVTSEALQHWPSDAELTTVEALALARSGAAERALAVLTPLHDAGARDEETLGILARVHKDLGISAHDTELAREHLARSRALYGEAFARHHSYWCGINAATLSLVLGDRDRARTLATEVRDACLRDLSREHTDEERYWLHATLAEAALLIGDTESAQSWYRHAALSCLAAWGHYASTRRNAALIVQHAGLDARLLEDCLPRPRIVVFTGHMIDAADRVQARFPADAEGRVKDAISRHLAAIDARIGFSSAACGSDILFLEAMLERGAEINVVLPSAPATFIAESVDRVASGRWRDRFERVLGRATTVELASQESTGAVFLGYANLIMYGLAKTRARETDGELSALAVWNGVMGAAGGTGSAIALWRDCGQQVDAIDPSTLAVTALPPTNAGALAQWQSSVLASDGAQRRRLVSMLFADAVGFSKLKEEDIPRFVDHFLGGIAKLAHRAGIAPTVRNTWGDAIYFAFEDVRAAGVLALDICDFIAATDWTQLGLPATLAIRIGLHSGPAYPVMDPVIERLSYTGVHVSRAARIEPITPPGTVYASAEFAALSEAVGVREFTCEYVGRTFMAKNDGQLPTYRVRRARISTAARPGQAFTAPAVRPDTM